MAAKGNTTAVVDLDVQGMGVEKAIDLISQKILKIQNQISSIVGSTDKATASFDRKLSLTVKELQRSVSQLNALQSNAEKRGFGSNDRLRLQRELNAAEVKGIRDVETASRARLGAENQIRVARERLAVSAAKEKRTLYETIKTEQLRLTEINKQEAALRRLAAAREKEARASQGPVLFGQGGGLGVLARTAGYAAAGTAIFAVAGAANSAVQFTVELEKKLAQLEAISGSTGGEMEVLSGKILDVARNSAFSTAELADASITLAQAGFSAQDISQALGAASNLAIAAGASMSDSVDLITSAIGSYNLQASEAERVSAGLIAALNGSKLSLEQVRLGLSYVGATAAENNLSLEETVAVMGTLAQAGIRSGSTIGTGVRQLLVDLQSPSKKLTETMTRLGLTFDDIDVKTLGVEGVLKNLASAGFNSAEAYGSLEVRAAAAYLALSRNIPTIENLRLAQVQAAGSSDAAAKAADNLSSQWQRTKNILGEAVSKGVTPFTNALKELFKAYNDGATDKYIQKLQEVREAQIRATGNTTQADREFVAQSLQYLEAMEYRNDVDEKYSEQLDNTATKLARSTEAVDAQRTKLSALSEAIEKTKARQGSLADESVALQVETLSLAGRFAGLAQYLDESTNSAGGLLNALRQLRLEESQNLAGQLQTKEIDAQDAARTRARAADAKIRAFRKSGAINALDPQQRADFEKFARDPLNEILRQRIGDAALELPEGSAARSFLTDIVKQVQSTKQAVETKNTTASQRAVINELNSAKMVDYQGRIDALAAPNTSEASVRKMLTELQSQSNAPGVTKAQRGAYDQLITRTEALLGRTGAVPTAEIPRPKGLTRSTTSIYEVQRDLDREGYMFGERVGQDSGGHKGRGHKDKRAIDVSLQVGEDRDPKVVAKQNAKALELQKKGFWVLWGGKSYNPDGSITSITGSDKHTDHMHIEEPKGGAYTREGAEERAFDEEVRRQRQAEKRIAKLKVSTADKGLKDDIEELQYVVSEAALETGKGTVKTSFEAWVEALKEQAVVDTATMDASELAEYNDELKDKISQRAQDIASKITDGFLALMDRMEEASDRAMANSLRPFESEISRLQAQIGGLDRASLSGKVPDYVRTLANRRLGDAQERLEGARLLTMPSRVAAQQGLVGRQEQFLKDNEGNLSAEELEKANNQLFTMKQTLFDLTSQLSGLQAAASAGQLISTDAGENVRQAARAWTELRNTQQGWAQTVGSEVAPALDFLEGGLNDMFNNMANGSRTALQAFGDMARGIIRYIQQLVIKIIASKIIELLGALLGGSVGPSFAGGSPAGGSSGAGFAGGSSTGIGTGSFVPRTTRFNGGPAPAGAPKRFIAGGRVTNGYPGRDSVNALLAQDEFVVRSAAVKSVGSAFMSDLNKNGARALRGMQQLAVLPTQGKNEMNVYVVKPDAAPSMKPNDVLATIHDDILRDGATKKLIRHVSQGG